MTLYPGRGSTRAAPMLPAERITLNSLQLQMTAAVLACVPRIAVRAGWGAGKSFGLGLALKLLALARPGDHLIWITDTGPRLGRVVQPVCERLLGRDGWKWCGDLRKHYWQAENGSRIYLMPYVLAGTKRAEQSALEGWNGSAAALDERVAADSIVETPDGPRTIGDIVRSGYDGDVRGYDHAAGMAVWTPVLARRWYDNDLASYRFATEDGATLDCTGNHPIWADGAYVEASKLFEVSNASCYDAQRGSANPWDAPRRLVPDDAIPVRDASTAVQPRVVSVGVRVRESRATGRLRVPWSVATPESGVGAGVGGCADEVPRVHAAVLGPVLPRPKEDRIPRVARRSRRRGPRVVVDGRWVDLRRTGEPVDPQLHGGRGPADAGVVPRPMGYRGDDQAVGVEADRGEVRTLPRVRRGRTRYAVSADRAARGRVDALQGGHAEGDGLRCVRGDVHAEDAGSPAVLLSRMRGDCVGGAGQGSQGRATRRGPMPDLWAQLQPEAPDEPGPDVLCGVPQAREVDGAERCQGGAHHRPEDADSVRDLRGVVRAARPAERPVLLRALPNGAVAPGVLAVAHRTRPIEHACDLTTGTGNFFAGGILVHNCQVYASDAVIQAVAGRVRTKGYPPVILMAGLPIAGAWWVRAAEESGGVALFADSFANRANLAPEWFEQLKHLPPALYRSRVLNDPDATTGAVYSMWSTADWPAGNIARGWGRDPAWPVRIAADFGYRSPWVGFFAQDPRGFDVLFHELHPDDCTVPDLIGALVRIACPRWTPPAEQYGRILVDSGAGDPGGLGPQSGGGHLSVAGPIADLSRPQPVGFGIKLMTANDPIRRNVETGTYRVQTWMLGNDNVRRLACTPEVWERGQREPRAFRRMIEELRWPDAGTAGGYLKDGKTEHVADGLRFGAINWHWFATPLDDRMPTAPEPQSTRASAIIQGSGRWRTGGGR